ncbi:hypothetical protein AD951_03920 [Acetobacter malorum]|uniref:NAD(P)-binding domain-containing protein n=1 Tax=Acetobacter malorum TaxID=178901 RepID=A0A149UQ06_9PROT|nr:NAD(P)H-binding protein [Acetobacter malorum]KXV70070.1 hypothetical protein AD951_03920 [Acetobacter malorum]
MKIAILGANGKTGTHLIQQALAAGHEVIAYVRRPEAVPVQAGVTIIGGQLDDVAGMARAFSGADAVVCCIGPKVGLPAMLKTVLMRTYLGPILKAVKQANVHRFVLMSAFGVGDTAKKASLLARIGYGTAFASIFGDKEQAEKLLPGSGLNWAAVYPVILYEAPPLAHVSVQRMEDVDHVPGLPKVTFANVATVLLDLAAHPERPGQRFLITA